VNDATETVSRTFEVYKCKLHGLVSTIEALGRRAKRIGVDGPRIVVGEEFSRLVKDKETGERAYYAMVRVEVSGRSPKIAGWTFGATIDHDGEENIIRAISGGFPASYRTVGPVCEHCKVRRRRNETFLLRHESGEWKQVGRSCLRDFLGHQDPEHCAAMAEHLAEAMEAAEESGFDGGYSSAQREPSIESYLSFVALAVRTNGWLARSKATDEGSPPTADLASMWMNKPSPGEVNPRPTDEDRATAEKAIAWARAISDDSGEFDTNLRAASKRVSVSQKNMGITAYIVQGYLNSEVRRQQRAARGESQYIGTVGLRYGAGKGKKAVPALKLLCEHVTTIDNDFGTTYLHHFSDERGNKAKWFASSECLAKGKLYAVTGTVKEHEEYKGEKQTVLSRCKAVEIAS